MIVEWNLEKEAIGSVVPGWVIGAQASGSLMKQKSFIMFTNKKYGLHAKDMYG